MQSTAANGLLQEGAMLAMWVNDDDCDDTASGFGHFRLLELGLFWVLSLLLAISVKRNLVAIIG
jgi:hypothetical protein